MIKVLQIVGAMNRGGLETFLMNVYRNIDRSQVQFDFLVHTRKNCAYDDEIRDYGGKIFAISSRNQGILNNYKALNEFFAAHSEYKIVHQHLSSLTYNEPLKIAKKYNVPNRIIHGHNTQEGGNFLHHFIHHWNRLFLEYYATDCFACSDLAARWLCGNRGNFTIVHNGIETDKFVYDESKRKAVRKAWGMENKLVIGHVGRFSYPKNHDFLIDIFQSVYKKVPRSVLLLVGEGELRGKIEQKVSSLGLQEQVVFTGLRSDIPEMLNAMDILVFPSLYEGFPVALVEAQSSGVKCIISDRITRQAAITDLIAFKSLSASPDEWANVVVKESRYTRRNTYNDIVHAGFDIKQIAHGLQRYYTTLYQEETVNVEARFVI